MKYDYLIVGAGLYGITCARLLTNKGFSCLIIDKNNYIGGVCHTLNKNNIIVHEFGPHVFHTSDDEVWSFVNKYVHFKPYELKVCATDGEKVYPMPFNMFVFSQILGKNTPEQVYEILSNKNKEEKNLKDVSINSVGEEIYEKLIKGYTEKLWGTSCELLSADIIKRLPVRYVYDNNYFDDIYQGLPYGGYTQLAENIINGINKENECFEGNIDLKLNTDFLSNKDYWLSIADHIIYCGSVDELLDYEFGELSWRSLLFEHKEYDFNGYNGLGCPILNNVLLEVPYTRVIDHIYFDKQLVKNYRGKTTITYEYPLKWEKGKERYYPNNSKDLYEKYVYTLKLKMPNVSLGGREGLYRYMDMDDTIRAAIDFCKNIEKPINDWEHYNRISLFCKIWVVGTNNDDVHINSDFLYYNSFITKSNPSKLNINPLNRFLSEYVAMWYVWKNNIYSEYVGFCHYRRMIGIDNINFTKLNNNNILYFHRIIWKGNLYHELFPKDAKYQFISRQNIWPIPPMIREDVIEYLELLTIISQDILKDYCTYKDVGFEYYNREIYLCKWEVFCNLMLFINGYINYIVTKYNLKTYEDWKNHISNNIISFYKKRSMKEIVGKKPYSFKLIFQTVENYLHMYDKDEGITLVCNLWRVYSYIIEDLISIYIGTHEHIHGKRIGS